MDKDSAQHEYLTTDEAADFLRLKPATLEIKRYRGDGPIFIRLGPGKNGRILYARKDLQAYIDAGRRTSTSDKGALAAAIPAFLLLLIGSGLAHALVI
jgi:hypothetical protein